MPLLHRFGQKRGMAAPPSAFPLLAKHTLFAGLPEEIRRDLVAKGSLVRIPKYSLMFHQRDDVTAVYLILEGLVKLYRDLGETDRTWGFRYKGDMVGTDSLHASGGHLYSAQALAFVSACAFPRDILTDLTASSPEFCEALFQHAANELETSLREQDVLTSRSTNGRIADKILILAEKFGRISGSAAPSVGVSDAGRAESQGVVLQLRITQRELASLAGTNRESVCKALVTFKREGSIDILQNKLILVKNQTKLASWP
ncbi:Crp/Fnr family transcriptional regulator [bacterium]|nr:Crp/Fnr family transcriptional regulator [bacterium]